MNKDLICEICGSSVSVGEEKKIHVANKQYTLCTWCQVRVMQYIDGNITHEIINIYWGAGHVCWSTWRFLRRIIKRYNIKEVLEMGIGLSTELFVNEGLNVIGIDVLKQHVSLYQGLLPLKSKEANAVFHWYPDSQHVPNFDKLYPGRKWDFVFVDGPQRRANEVKLAMKLSNRFIYLHDPNLGEEGFFPNDEWKNLDGDPKLFEKVKINESKKK